MCVLWIYLRMTIAIPLWILLLTLRCASCTENNVFIQPFSFPSDVVRGQGVTATCSVTAGDGPFTFRWTKDGQFLPSSEPEPLLRTSSEDHFSLLFLRSVDASRSGNYTCQAANSAGQAANYTAELIVYEPPEWSVVPDDSSEVVSGSDLRLDCSAVGVPTPKISWKKLQSDATGERHRILSNGSLLLLDARPEEGGAYECSASNGIGEVLRRTVDVIVHVPPHFRVPYEMLKVRSSHSAVLRCDVTGDAPIQVHWSRSSEYMDDQDSRYRTQETPLPNGLLSELSISRVVREDAGLYLCSASNAYGKREKTLKLVVLEPPASPSDVVVRQVSQTEATIQWTAPYSGNSPITRFVVQHWRDTGGPPRLSEENVDRQRASYSLKGLRPGTSYVVRLVAENEFGASAPSPPLRFTTAEDVPSGYPTDLTVFSRGRNDLVVRWNAPAPEQRNGVIRGYELCWRERGSSGPFATKEVLGAHEFVLEGLKGDTEYEVSVRALNGAGRGPPSLPVVARTRDRGSLIPPELRIESTTASSISLRWSGDGGGTHIRLHFRRAEGSGVGEWEERMVVSAPPAYTLTGLQSDSLYFLYARSVRGEEESGPSQTLSARTDADPSSLEQRTSSLETVTNHTTLVISLSVAVSCVVIVCVIAAAFVYVTKVRQAGHMATGLSSVDPPTSRSTPALSRHTSNFRYVDVNARPLLWCSTPAPPNDYPSPYATLPLRPPSNKRWHSSEDAFHSSEASMQRVEVPEDKVSCT